MQQPIDVHCVSTDADADWQEIHCRRCSRRLMITCLHQYYHHYHWLPAAETVVIETRTTTMHNYNGRWRRRRPARRDDDSLLLLSAAHNEHSASLVAYRDHVPARRQLRQCGHRQRHVAVENHKYTPSWTPNSITACGDVHDGRSVWSEVVSYSQRQWVNQQVLVCNETTRLQHYYRHQLITARWLHRQRQWHSHSEVTTDNRR